MTTDRTPIRKQLYAKQLRDAKLSLFIWRSPGCSHVGVRELETDQIKRAKEHFLNRIQECTEELARRNGEPKPNFIKYAN